MGFFPADSVHQDGQGPSTDELVRERSGSLAAGGARRALGVSSVEPELRLSPFPTAGRRFRGEEGQVRSLCPQKSFPSCLLRGSSGERDLPNLQVHPSVVIPGSL